MKESQFQIMGNPRIVESYFKLNREYKSDRDVEIILSTSNSAQIDPETEQIALVELTLNVFEDEELSEVPFKISVKVDSFFTWNDELANNPDLLDRLINQNAPAILYGYIRQEIRAMTMNANIPTLDIPVMDFTSK